MKHVVQGYQRTRLHHARSVLKTVFLLELGYLKAKLVFQVVLVEIRILDHPDAHVYFHIIFLKDSKSCIGSVWPEVTNNAGEPNELYSLMETSRGKSTG